MTPTLTPLHQGSLLSPNPYFNPVASVPLHNEDGTLNMVIEIPTGTNWKIETCEQTGQMAVELRKGAPRIVRYLSYPGNYGFFPQTLTDPNKGFDHDPVDAICLSPPLPTGAIVKVKLLGAIDLLDDGERDIKAIVVDKTSPMAHVESLEQLKSEFPGVIDILKIWFENYKTENPDHELKVQGELSREDTLAIIEDSCLYYHSTQPSVFRM